MTITPRGRRSTVPQDVIDRMLAMRDDGVGYPTIAKTLNEHGVPTPGGGAEWYPASVRNVVLAAESRRSDAADEQWPKRRLTVKIGRGAEMNDETFAELANAVWYLVSAATPAGHFSIEPDDSITADALNKAWKAGPRWS